VWPPLDRRGLIVAVSAVGRLERIREHGGHAARQVLEGPAPVTRQQTTTQANNTNANHRPASLSHRTPSDTSRLLRSGAAAKVKGQLAEQLQWALDDRILIEQACPRSGSRSSPGWRGC
jgi:hypothetical protein